MLYAVNNDAKVIIPVYIHDLEEKQPVLLSLVGPKGATRGLAKKAMLRHNIDNKENPPFHIEGLANRPTGFYLPTGKYREFTTRLGETRLYESRLVSQLAEVGGTNNPNECYVLVSNPIIINQRNYGDDEKAWVQYLVYRSTGIPAAYEAPKWAEDLYRMFLALKSRLKIPMHPSWMVYLFAELSNTKAYLGSGEYAKPIRLINGFITPELDEFTGDKPIERAAYHLVGKKAEGIWKSYIISNPNRATYINFDL